LAKFLARNYARVDAVSVDGNFKRLEDEVTQLLETLDDLRQQNATLQNRVESLEAQNRELSQTRERLAVVEEEYKLAVKSREEVRARVESILSQLEGAPGSLAATASPR
jgi:chromosome segregation ATPase